MRNRISLVLTGIVLLSLIAGSFTPTSVSAQEPPEPIVATLSPGESITETMTVSLVGVLPKADIVLAFDLTGSMSGVINTAKARAVEIMTSLSTLIEDPRFAVTSYMDYPHSYSSCGYSSSYGSSSVDYAYRLDQALTPDTSSVQAAINSLVIGSGNDGPQNYTRIMYESYAELVGETNPTFGPLGYREGAKKILINFGDDVPHDCNLNENVTTGTWSTGGDPGRDELMSTADDLDLQTVLETMAANDVTLLEVHTTSTANTHWKYWTGLTGGDIFITSASGSGIVDAVLDLVGTEASHIDELKIATTPGFESWVTSIPLSYTNIDTPATLDFEIEVTVPLDTPSGVYEFQLIVVGDGAAYVYQDVKITVGGKVPVIIVPGFLASWNRGVLLDSDSADTNWNWSNLRSILGLGIVPEWYDAGDDWEEFIESLEDAGYVNEVDYSVCFYDWRKTLDWTDGEDSHEESSEAVRSYLANCIDDILDKPENDGVTKVNLVSHSFGGLVSRSYIESPYYDLRNDVTSVITLGSPHSGTPLVYYLWEGAEAPPTWGIGGDAILWYTLKNLKHNHRGEMGYDNDFNTIRTALKSTRDLLPVGYDYLLDQNLDFVDWQSMSEVNYFLRDRMPPSGAVSMFTAKNVKLYTIAGSDNLTVNRLLVDTTYNNPPYWIDGKAYEHGLEIDGDGTVTVLSAQIPGTELPNLTGLHRNLPYLGAESSFATLGIPYNDTGATVVYEPLHIFVVILLSPATFTIEDSEGNVIGEYGSVEETKTALVTEAEPGQYTIKVVGTGEGPYELDFGYFGIQQNQTFEIHGEVRPGTEHSYLVNYEPADPESMVDISRILDIDIKPGSDPNSINCRNKKEVITVAILTTESFDTLTVDHTSVTFEGGSEIHRDKKTGLPLRHEEDVDLDGDLDLVFHFRLGDTNLTCASTSGTIIGLLSDGTAFTGTDTIRMVRK